MVDTFPYGATYPISETIHASDGAAIDADSTPTYNVYAGPPSAFTTVLTAQAMTKYANVTGAYYGSFVLTGASWVPSRIYTVITTATVGGITAHNVSGIFRISGQEIVAGYPVSHLASGAVTAMAMAPDALSAAAFSDAAIDKFFDELIGDGSFTFRQTVRIIAAAVAGKVSGAGTVTVTVRNMTDTKAVIVATADAVGNRSALTLTP